MSASDPEVVSPPVADLALDVGARLELPTQGATRELGHFLVGRETQTDDLLGAEIVDPAAQVGGKDFLEAEALLETDDAILRAQRHRARQEDSDHQRDRDDYRPAGGEARRCEESHCLDADVGDQNGEREEVPERYESPVTVPGLRRCRHCACLLLICTEISERAGLRESGDAARLCRLSGDLSRRIPRIALEPYDHGVEPGLARGETDALHERSDEIGWDGERRGRGLSVHRSEDDGENGGDGGRLAGVEIGVEVHPAVAHFGNDVDARLALGNVEGTAIDVLESLRERLELLRVLDQRLHLFLTPHRSKQLQHAIDRRRNTRSSSGSALHSRQSNYLSPTGSSYARREGCRPEKRQRCGKVDSSRGREHSKPRAAPSAASTTSRRASKAEQGPIPRSCSPRLRPRVSAWRSARAWRKMERLRRGSKPPPRAPCSRFPAASASRP